MPTVVVDGHHRGSWQIGLRTCLAYTGDDNYEDKSRASKKKVQPRSIIYNAGVLVMKKGMPD